MRQIIFVKLISMRLQQSKSSQMKTLKPQGESNNIKLKLSSFIQKMSDQNSGLLDQLTLTFLSYRLYVMSYRLIQPVYIQAS
ncbi:hypothetical protein pb186bvf_014161 [Paramecium bursaria]